MLHQLANHTMASADVVDTGLFDRIKSGAKPGEGGKIRVFSLANNMVFDIGSRHRTEFNGAPIYLNENQPDWFIPNRSGDKLLHTILHALVMALLEETGFSGIHLIKRFAYREARCFYCGETHPATGLCGNGHFVCDACHAEDGLKVIRHICLKKAAQLSAKYLAVTLQADCPLPCAQKEKNKECMGKGCPLHPLFSVKRKDQ